MPQRSDFHVVCKAKNWACESCYEIRLQRPMNTLGSKVLPHANIS